MKKLILAALLLCVTSPLCGSVDLSSDVTIGKGGYRASQTTLTLRALEVWNIWGSYGYAKSGGDTPGSQSYSGGVGLNAAKNLNFRGSYSSSPKVEGFTSETWSFGLTLGVDYGGTKKREADFNTMLDFDYAQTNDEYNVWRESAKIPYKTRWGEWIFLFIPEKMFTVNLRQERKSARLTETFFQSTSLYIGFSDFNYDPDIETGIHLFKTRLANTMLFDFAQGLTGYPSNSYEAGISWSLARSFVLNFDYLRVALIDFNDYNGTATIYEPVKTNANSYMFGWSYCQTQWFSYRLSYNRYQEENSISQNYYSGGISFSF